MARLIQRDDPPKKAPAPPTPVNPFDVPPHVELEARALIVTELKALTGDQVLHAKIDYLHAITKAQASVAKKKEELQASQQATLDLILTVALLGLGPVAGKISAAVASPAVKKAVEGQVADKMSKLLEKANVGVGKSTEYTMWLVDKVTKYGTPENAGKGIEAVGGKLKSAAKISLAGGPHDATIRYLDALAYAADASSQALSQAIFALSDPATILGIFDALKNTTLQKYEVQIDQEATDFLTQMTETSAASDHAVSDDLVYGVRHSGNFIGQVDAYGSTRLAKFSFEGGHPRTDDEFLKNTIKFVVWLTPNMEGLARQSGSIVVVPAGGISGHLPDPTREMSGERYVQVDAWGKMRVVAVKADDSWFNKDGMLHFSRWIPDDDAETTAIRGQMQIGGFETVQGSQIKGMHAP